MDAARWPIAAQVLDSNLEQDGADPAARRSTDPAASKMEQLPLN